MAAAPTWNMMELRSFSSLSSGFLSLSVFPSSSKWEEYCRDSSEYDSSSRTSSPGNPEIGSSGGVVLCVVSSPRDSTMFRITWESPVSTVQGAGSDGRRAAICPRREGEREGDD